MYNILIQHLYTFQCDWHSKSSSTHLSLCKVIMTLLTAFPVLSATYPWLTCFISGSLYLRNDYSSSWLSSQLCRSNVMHRDVFKSLKFRAGRNFRNHIQTPKHYLNLMVLLIQMKFPEWVGGVRSPTIPSFQPVWDVHAHSWNQRVNCTNPQKHQWSHMLTSCKQYTMVNVVYF